jgi:hypothetical protein
MLVCSLFVISLPALESNDTECTEEGEVFDYQEEDEGQANQGKPSKLVAYLIPVLLIAQFITVYENALFFCCYCPK